MLERLSRAVSIATNPLILIIGVALVALGIIVLHFDTTLTDSVDTQLSGVTSTTGISTTFASRTIDDVASRVTTIARLILGLGSVQTIVAGFGCVVACCCCCCNPLRAGGLGVRGWVGVVHAVLVAGMVVVVLAIWSVVIQSLKDVKALWDGIGVTDWGALSSSQVASYEKNFNCCGFDEATEILNNCPATTKSCKTAGDDIASSVIKWSEIAMAIDAALVICCLVASVGVVVGERRRVAVNARKPNA